MTPKQPSPTPASGDQIYERDPDDWALAHKIFADLHDPDNEGQPAAKIIYYHLSRHRQQASASVAAENARLRSALDKAYIEMLGAEMVLSGKSTNATGALAETDWRPERAHIEGMRNTMNEALAYLADVRLAIKGADHG